MSNNKHIFQFKITLAEVEPTVWAAALAGEILTDSTDVDGVAADVPGCLADQVLSTWSEWCPSSEADGEVSRFLQERCPKFARQGN